MRPRAWLYCGGRSGWYFGWGDVWGCWWRRCLPCIDKGFCGGGGGEGGGVAVDNHYKQIKTTVSSYNLYETDLAYVAVQLGHHGIVQQSLYAKQTCAAKGAWKCILPFNAVTIAYCGKK